MTAATPRDGGDSARIVCFNASAKAGWAKCGWRSRLEPVQRQVAVKLIKPGMDSARVIARFEAERQTLALMDHPAIAKVFDAGTTPEGRPYFAMEYVRGDAITAYCDRAAADGPRPD